jgi:diguanylate cyclase (GGDEF)-like protein
MARGRLDITLGVGDEPARRQQLYVALGVCLALVVCAVLSGLFGRAQGPVVVPFVPIAATVWSLADLLTAFLLLAQFYVNGRLSFAILSVGYGLSGLLSVPYLIAFPGLFSSGTVTLGVQQLALVFWVIWHCSFPAIVMLSRIGSSRESRITSRKKIFPLTVVFFFLPTAMTIATAALAYGARDALPHLIVDGHFQALYLFGCLPVIILINAAACASLLARRERLSALGLMLCIAMFSALIDSVMNLSGARYAFAWDVGKLITIFTSSVVLLMFLTEIVDSYGRLEVAAQIDQLTQLPNRRALDEHLRLVLKHGQRAETSLAFFMIDIDLFKNFNDSFGHAAGDDCLRGVAATLAKFATRPLDFIARYGGEEFLVILPGTPLAGTRSVAEQMRAGVEALAIGLSGGVSAGVTVSIGIGFAENAATVEAPVLFEAADRALYEAKSEGRNRVVVTNVAGALSEQQTMPEAVGVQ